jgi:heterotetrameric sarcosine oxidase gamma subunit
MTNDALTPIAPFTGLGFSAADGDGVVVTDRDGLGLATVLVHRSRVAALTARIRERFGIDLPHGPYRSAADGLAFAGISPEAWLATNEAGSTGFAARLNEALGDLAAIADQSSGYAVLRLTGPKLRETLAKILPLDLHPRAFGPGAVASTVASHVGATLWRLGDAADGSPVFEIAVFRSLAGSFWHALTVSAAEFGFVSEGSSSRERSSW